MTLRETSLFVECMLSAHVVSMPLPPGSDGLGFSWQVFGHEKLAGFKV